MVADSTRGSSCRDGDGLTVLWTGDGLAVLWTGDGETGTGGVDWLPANEAPLDWPPELA
jgi:hypothetical protein